jgi:endonuclease/exonuclease/phosphatase (EEP) superfamily protein YafD
MTRSLRAWVRGGAVAFAVLYAGALLGVVILLRVVGERWWASGVILFLPRLGFAIPAPVAAVWLLAVGCRRMLILPTLCALVVLFPLMGFVSPSPLAAEETPHAKAFRILSYNVNSGFGGEDALLEQIEHFSPDVVVLQEIGSRADSLTRRFATRYLATQVSTQFLIASRFPIVSTREPERLPYFGKMRSPRFIQYVVDTPLGKIAVYNVHPLSPREGFAAIRRYGLRHEILSGRLFFSDSSSELTLNNGLREFQIRVFTEQASGEPYPVIIAGDTNSPGLSPVFGKYLSRYRDAFVDASWGLGYTFPTTRRPWMRIDRVLGSESIRFTGFQTGESVASDHRCVVADVQLRTP